MSPEDLIKNNYMPEKTLKVCQAHQQGRHSYYINVFMGLDSVQKSSDSKGNCWQSAKSINP